MTAPAGRWINRIVGHGSERPDQLLANPDNWRIHPREQQSALGAVLDSVGWVQNIVVNRTTGHVVDGHLRVSLAITRDEKAVPVTYVELSEDEERMVLATMDPLSAMAVTDRDALAALIEQGEGALDALLAGSPEMLAKLDDLGGNVRATDFPGLRDIDEPEYQQMTFVLHREQVPAVLEAVKAAAGPSEVNANRNGSGLHRICESFLAGR